MQDGPSSSWAYVLTTPSITKRLDTIIAEMKRDLTKRRTINYYARRAQYSRYHFQRIFQAYTGYAPGLYQSKVRYDHAAHLLLTTKYNVTTIMKMVGYQSLGSFTTKFTQYHGLPPTYYRHYVQSLNRTPPAPDRLDKWK